MKQFRRVLPALFILPGIILLVSCGASHNLRTQTLQKESAFNYSQLKRDGLIIGGVASDVITLTPELRFEYNEILGNTLLAKLPDVHMIKITNPLQLISKTGRDTYMSMMDQYDQSKLFDDEIIQFMQDSIPDSKYILMAYIENENVIDHSYDEYIEEDGEEKVETQYEKTYLLAVEFQVFDFMMNRSVWKAVIFNEARKTESRTTRSGCAEGCMDSLIDSIISGEPAEIDREEVLAKISEKLCEELPKI